MEDLFCRKEQIIKIHKFLGLVFIMQCFHPGPIANDMPNATSKSGADKTC